MRSAYKEEGCDHDTYSAGPAAFELEEGLAFLYCKENDPKETVVEVAYPPSTSALICPFFLLASFQRVTQY